MWFVLARAIFDRFEAGVMARNGLTPVALAEEDATRRPQHRRQALVCAAAPASASLDRLAGGAACSGRDPSRRRVRMPSTGRCRLSRIAQRATWAPARAGAHYPSMALLLVEHEHVVHGLALGVHARLGQRA